MIYAAIIATIAIAAVVGILIGGYCPGLSWRMNHSIGDAWACVLFFIPALLFCVVFLVCRSIGALRQIFGGVVRHE